MGAEYFTTISSGKTVKEAFRNAIDDARYEYGNRGYTGSIAEKDSYVVLKGPVPLNEAYDTADRCSESSRFEDKWGPAGCIELEDGRYLFFGWASS